MKLGYKSIQEIIAHGKYEPYVSSLSKIFEREKGWIYVHEVYKFTYNKSRIIQNRDETVSDQESKHKLNTIVLEAIDTQAQIKFNNNRLKYSDEHLYSLPADYIKNQHLLSDKLIKIKNQKGKE